MSAQDQGASVPDQAGRAALRAADASRPSGDHPSRGVLMKLAERCEAAQDSSREIDAAIADAIRWWPAGFARRDVHGPDRRWCDDRRISGRVPDRIDCPAFSISVDAAMTLVLEEADSAGERYRLEAYNKPGVLAAHVRASAWVAGAERVYAATPALALCAAALRARAGEP